MKIRPLLLSFMCFVLATNASMSSFLQPSGYFTHLKPLTNVNPFVYLWNLPRSTKIAVGSIGGLIAGGYFLSKRFLIDRCLGIIELFNLSDQQKEIEACGVRLNTTSQYFFSQSQLTRLKELRKKKPEVFYWPNALYYPSYISGQPLPEDDLYPPEQLKRTLTKKADPAFNEFYEKDKSTILELVPKIDGSLQNLKEKLKDKTQNNAELKELAQSIDRIPKRHLSRSVRGELKDLKLNHPSLFINTK